MLFRSHALLARAAARDEREEVGAVHRRHAHVVQDQAEDRLLDLAPLDHLDRRDDQALVVDGLRVRRQRAREAAAGVLSPAIANRPKTGFTLPIGDWMRGEMRESCEESIRRVASLPFIEGEEVRRVWLSFLKDDRAIHWSRPLALVVLGSALEYAVSPSGDSAACAALPG